MKLFRDLPVKLTDAEWAFYANALAVEQARRAQAEADKAESMSAFKATIDKHKAKEAELGEKVRSREETRAVECFERFDYKRFVVDLHRDDTGELVETRQMSASERQTKLPGVDDEESN
jgi:hypothetical protein